jgi:sporulation protein YlmC with PRC-barrel domain
MHELIGKEVEVNTTEITYRGTLVEIGESEIHLQSETGWITIPVERVVDVKAIS